MEDILVSIIVPIYNVEKYIEKCIKSLINQTYSNIEILLINDGTKDNSREICEFYEAKDNRVLILDKENGGLSDARNYGVEKAKGKYVVFVDGDDFVHEQYIELLLNSASMYNTDISICSFSVIDDNGKIIKNEVLSEVATICTGRKILENVLTSYGYKYVVAWNKIYKKDIFNKLHFDKGMLYEDEYINFKLFYDCEKVSIVKEELYYYVQRQGSITISCMTPEKIEMKLQMHRKRISFYKKQNNIVLYEKAIKMYCNWIVETFRKDVKLLTKEKKRFFKTEIKKYVSTSIKSKHFSQMEKFQNIIAVVSLNCAAKLKSLIKH